MRPEVRVHDFSDRPVTLEEVDDIIQIGTALFTGIGVPHSVDIPVGITTRFGGQSELSSECGHINAE